MIENPGAFFVSLSKIGRNVRWGVAQGASFSAIACVVVTLFEIPQWHMYREHVWVVVATYLGAGIGVGAVVGLLRPFTRHLIGAMVVGIVAAIPFAVALNLAASLPRVGPIDWKAVRFLALVCGPLGGFIRWKQTWGRSASSDSQRGS